MTDVRTALKQGLAQLREAHVPSFTLAAELLLLHVLCRDRTLLYAHPEEQVSPADAERFFALVARRANGEPTQHLTGKQEFWGLEFEVTPECLDSPPGNGTCYRSLTRPPRRPRTQRWPQTNALRRRPANRRHRHRLRMHRHRPSQGTPRRRDLRHRHFAPCPGRRPTQRRTPKRCRPCPFLGRQSSGRYSAAPRSNRQQSALHRPPRNRLLDARSPQPRARNRTLRGRRRIRILC